MTTVGTKPVRVVVVDDSEDIRFLLRAQFARDERFEVVGEAFDGAHAVAVAAKEHPDLLILDQQMPGRTGLEVISEIRECSPETAIILYTAHADGGFYQAAFDAGACEVLAKIAVGRGFVEQLVGAIAERVATEDSMMEIRVGPVSAHAARVWIENTTKILDAVVAHPEVLGTNLPEDVVELYRMFLRQWDAIATTGELRFVARSNPADIHRLVHHWATIDAMTDEQLERLGVTWAPPEGAPFFVALTSGVLEALHHHDETKRLAERLGEQWANYLKR